MIIKIIKGEVWNSIWVYLGIIKEIDNLGRIVIPKEFRERLKLKKRVELVLTKSGLLIRNAEYEMAKTEKPRIQKK